MVYRWNAVKGVFDDDWNAVQVSVLQVPCSLKKVSRNAFLLTIIMVLFFCISPGESSLLRFLVSTLYFQLEVPAWELWSTKVSELQIKSVSSSTPCGQTNTMITTIKVSYKLSFLPI